MRVFGEAWRMMVFVREKARFIVAFLLLSGHFQMTGNEVDSGDIR